MKLIASGRVGIMLAAMTMIAGCGASQRPGTTTVTSAAALAPMEPTAPINASTLVPAAWEEELDAAPGTPVDSVVPPAAPTWGTPATPATKPSTTTPTP